MNFTSIKNHSQSDYLRLLTEGKKVTEELADRKMSNNEFLGDYIFEYTTYEDEILSLMAFESAKVCRAISTWTTQAYVRSSPANEFWYLMVVNYPFFMSRIDWGTSIRGAWWWNNDKDEFTLKSTGLWWQGDQVTELKFDTDGWKAFTLAIYQFSEADFKDD